MSWPPIPWTFPLSGESVKAVNFSDTEIGSCAELSPKDAMLCSPCPLEGVKEYIVQLLRLGKKAGINWVRGQQIPTSLPHCPSQ